MLRDAQLFANLRASDLDAVIDFYPRKLGLELIWDGGLMPGHREVLFDAAAPWSASRKDVLPVPKDRRS